MSNASSSIFVAGTDTGIGKTIFSAALVGQLNAHYWKPIQSGLEEETDSEVVARLSGVDRGMILEEGYKLTHPLSPHRSAELDDVEIDWQALMPPQVQGPLVMEGAGGLMVPISRNRLQIDQIAQWACPVVLCARTGLGTINHTLLSLEALRARKIPLLGVVFIGAEIADTIRTISEMGDVKILGRLPNLEVLTPDYLKSAFSSHFDLNDFQMKQER